MVSKKLLALSAVFFSAAVWAQSIGTVGSVSGVVTINDGTRVLSAAPGSPIPDGARIVTTSSGSAVLQLANGCVIDLKPNQAVTVLRGSSCGDLAAAVRPTGAAQAAAGGSNFGVGDAFIVGTGIIVTYKVIDDFRNRRKSGS